LVSEENFVSILSPGDGQYDCLSLHDGGNNLLIQLNRKGENALANEVLVENIWSRAALNPHECALYILSESDLEVETEKLNIEKQKTLEALVNISNYLNENFKSNIILEWGWIDNQYLSDANPILDQFSIPPNWKELGGPSNSVLWPGWIYVIKDGDNLVSLVNLKNGESVDLKGNKWNRWPKHEINIEENISAHFGYEFKMKFPNKETMNIELVHQSMKRKTYRIYTEEGCEVSTTPLFQISSNQAIDLWNMIENTEKYQNQINNFLE